MWATGLIEEAQHTPALAVLLGPQAHTCEVGLLAFPLATAVPPLDLPFFFTNVQLPCSPNQPGSEPLYQLCYLISLTAPYPSWSKWHSCLEI